MHLISTSIEKTTMFWEVWCGNSTMQFSWRSRKDVLIWDCFVKTANEQFFLSLSLLWVFWEIVFPCVKSPLAANGEDSNGRVFVVNALRLHPSLGPINFPNQTYTLKPIKPPIKSLQPRMAMGTRMLRIWIWVHGNGPDNIRVWVSVHKCMELRS